MKPIGFGYFDVKGIMEFCKNHIIEGIRRENESFLKKERVGKKLSEKLIQENIDIMFPSRYSTAVLLVAECLAEFSKKGVFVIEDYETEVEMENLYCKGQMSKQGQSPLLQHGSRPIRSRMNRPSQEKVIYDQMIHRKARLWGDYLPSTRRIYARWKITPNCIN